MRNALAGYLTGKAKQPGIEVKVDKLVPPLFAKAGRAAKGNIRPLIRAAYTRN